MAKKHRIFSCFEHVSRRFQLTFHFIKWLKIAIFFLRKRACLILIYVLSKVNKFRGEKYSSSSKSNVVSV